MSRGLTDEPIQNNDAEDLTQLQEIEQIIQELIKGQNKIHDRVIDLERTIDHMKKSYEATDYRATANPKSKWKLGL